MLAAIFHNFALGRHLQFLTNIVISRKTVLTVTEIHPKTRSQEHTKEALFLPSADPSLLPPLVTSVRPEHCSDTWVRTSSAKGRVEGACGASTSLLTGASGPRVLPRAGSSVVICLLWLLATSGPHRWLSEPLVAQPNQGKVIAPRGLRSVGPGLQPSLVPASAEVKGDFSRRRRRRRTQDRAAGGGSRSVVSVSVQQNLPGPLRPSQGSTPRDPTQPPV